jgi:hypothetical protein
MLRYQIGQAQLLAQLAHQEHPGVGRHTIGTSLDQHRTIALEPKQRTLNFTHGVSRPFRDEGAFVTTSSYCGASRYAMGFLHHHCHASMSVVNNVG